MLPLLHYRYFQPADGSRHYPVPDSYDSPAVKLVYAGSIALDELEPILDLLARLLARHATPFRPEGAGFRPAATGDLLDLGELGLWQVLPVGFRPLPPEQLHLAAA